MKILALEFSSPARSVAVAENGAVLGRAAEQGTRETKAFALIESVLEQAQWRRDDIDCIAVGIGPGSYAGIRIAISIAQGWQLARGVKLLGISSADCVAAQVHDKGRRGILNVLVDAQRGEMFAARYELENEWSKVEGFALVTADEQARRAAAGELMVRPDLDAAAAPDAATIARLASVRTDHLTGPQLEPIYLRKAEFVKAPPPRIIGGTGSASPHTE
ncbi:MAG TPA: tRNA (adenosine(37)-N6)-threonylcarbamoyltransferase complex dimerization subunit type 1 TsaB [Candidatus Acidoferrum sp.]|nr:tRNA (adenosine(37)-N6)-threonylcarbamoyltransferase complex dimerization subunit type 1 TsaB [Candidatus Acidoferrum sp.]